jgi:CRISPR-associated protein Cmr4
MKTMLLGLLAETSIHPGSGQDAGFVDLPVAREASTSYPVIVGSSFKGALLDRARVERIEKTTLNTIFGEQDSAGNLIVSDVRLVALPVRSLSSTYKWVTCPHLIERLIRDMKRMNISSDGVSNLSINQGDYLGSGSKEIYLEERQFGHGGNLPDGLVNLIKSLILHKETANRLDDQLVVLHNDDFVWFARYGLAVTARNVLDNEKKTSENLWYEETIPTDSIFYSLLAERGGNALSEVSSLFKEKPYIQVGGNATVGQGWFAVKLVLQNGAEQ